MVDHTEQTATEQMPTERTAAVIIIGQEILSGRTQDTNLSYIAAGLSKHGITLRRALVLPDHIATIAEAINQLRSQVHYLFTTGGIGPTHDDITAQAVAAALGRPLARHAAAVVCLQEHYGKDNLNEARLSMADMPTGADLIDNPVSRSPGFQVENVYVLAGVPRIMQAMFDGLLPNLTGGRPILSESFNTFLAEGDIADGLRTIQDHHPDIDIGSYPYFRRHRFGVSIVLRGPDDQRLAACAAAVRTLIKDLEQAVDNNQESHNKDSHKNTQ